mmetsp:Transcript_35476/g.77697  ORF Transcript_35476/g.77697 Transcript_35476/m.77697 type:complete len:193 (-) Transcript_35476:42-620(-)
MEITWEQMLKAADDFESDSCSSWESVAVSEDERSSEWDVVSEVGSVQSVASTNSNERDVHISYKDVLLRMKARVGSEPIIPVVKSKSRGPWRNVTLLVMPVTTKPRVDRKPIKDDGGIMFDAESMRDGVKQCRGGSQKQMFKGTRRQEHKDFPSWYSDWLYFLPPEKEKERHRHRHRKGKRCLKSVGTIGAQ